MSDPSNDLVTIEAKDGCLVASLLTETLFDPLMVSDIEKLLHQAVSEAETPRMVIALDRVQHIASATISTLISLRSACQGKGGDCVLAAVPDRIMDILKVARLDTVFRSYPTATDAIASFAPAS
jgi:anti-anti-sigma factor